MKKVSIILTTYNGLDSIEKCLLAALSQDYDNFEVVVVDDNGRGTENQMKTQEIVESFANDNLKYISHPQNINGAAARNTGIRNSDGDYIAFLDDDDILHQDSISDRVKVIEAENETFGAVFASFNQFIAKNLDEEFILDISGNITKNYLLQKYSTPSSIIMIRRSVLDTVGYWDESFRRHQDWEFIVRLSVSYNVCSSKLITVDRYVTCRNDAKNPEQFAKERVFFLEKMESIINKFDTKTITEIYFVHYYDIGKQYLKRFMLHEGIAWMIKSKKPFKCVFCLLKSLYIKVKRVIRVWVK